ncbi:hypothetical protein CVG87_05930 [Pseudomonas sp. WCS365]|nr:hypothetical protein CVG87_05930 [Pseudomonas sp. WCS365]
MKKANCNNSKARRHRTNWRRFSDPSDWPPLQTPCGSELARDSGRSVSIDMTDTPQSRASSLPQGLCIGHKIPVRDDGGSVAQ